MNPLGVPFEMYDDFGRYRMEEFLEHPDNLIKKMPTQQHIASRIGTSRETVSRALSVLNHDSAVAAVAMR